MLAEFPSKPVLLLIRELVLSIKSSKNLLSTCYERVCSIASPFDSFLPEEKTGNSRKASVVCLLQPGWKWGPKAVVAKAGMISVTDLPI